MNFIWLSDAIQDIRYGVRTLRRSPGFTIITVFILALGIAANTAVLSVVNASLLRPLPFDRPEDLFVLYEKTPMTARFTVSYPNFLDWQRQTQTFERLAAGACYLPAGRAMRIDPICALR